MDQRSRQPTLREHHHRFRGGPHLVREQPGQPAHAVRERSGHRPDRRGDLRPRREKRHPVGRHAGTPETIAALSALGGAPRAGRDTVRPRGARNRSGAGGLRGAGRAREAVSSDVDQPLRSAAAPRALLILRMAARPTRWERPAIRRNGARPGNGRGPGTRPVRQGEGACRVRRRERAAALRHRRSWGVSRPQRFALPCGRARTAAVAEPVRRRPRPVCGAANGGGPRARRDAARRLRPRAGVRRGGSPRAPAAICRERRCGGRRGRARPSGGVLGRNAGRRARHHPRRLFRPAGQQVAPLSGSGVPHLGALRLLSVERRVRFPRPASGRAGAHAHAAGPHPRAHPAGCRAPVRGGGRAALVERPGWSGHSHALLRRPSLAPLRGGRVRQGHWRPRRPRGAGALPRGARGSARRARGVRDPGRLARDGNAVRARHEGRGPGAHGRRARPAAHRELRLERRLQPRRPRRTWRERVRRLVSPRRPGGLCPPV